MAVGLLTPSAGLAPCHIKDPCIFMDVGNGLFTLVELSCAGQLKDFTLRAKKVKEKGLFYVYAYKAGLEYPLHRLLLGLAPGDERQGDHINGYTLDNRKDNLRIASCSANSLNCNRRRANATGFAGVSFHGRSRKFTARIYIEGKRTCLGYFETPEQAAAAYTSKHEELINKWL